MEVKLEDIRPEEAPFTLDATQSHEHILRKFTLDDHSWLKHQLGKTLEEIYLLDGFERLEYIVQIAYRLLKDKTPFKQQTVKFIDEEGNEKDEFLGGLKLFKRMIIGPSEQIKIIKAVGIAINGQNPLSDPNAVPEKKSETPDLK